MVITCELLVNSTGDKEELNLSHGLSKDQSIKALSEWTSIPLDNLPPEAELIHGFSCGSPLVISIVGALLRDFPDRWQFYVAQMEAKKLQDLSSDSSYEYRSVYDAIEMSVEQLTTSQIEVYSWFAVFDEGAKLSSQVSTCSACHDTLILKSIEHLIHYIRFIFLHSVTHQVPSSHVQICFFALSQ